ncbi:hypothetical protein SAMN05428986_0322 [Enterobacter ludwigii]|nr:hypothetical protein SAMN05428986_0322 [Enterobacter ludwigii]
MPTALAHRETLCCAGSGSVAAKFDSFITEIINHSFLKLFLICHKSFIA